MLKESLLGWGGFQKDKWPIKSRHELILLSNDAFTSVSPSMYTFFEDGSYHSKTNKTEYWWTASTSSDNHNSCYTFSRNPSVGDVIYFTDGDVTTATITEYTADAITTSENRSYRYDHIAYPNIPERFTINTGLTSRNTGTYPDRIVSGFDVATGTYIFIAQDKESKNVSITQMEPNTFAVLFHEVVRLNNLISSTNPNVQPFWKDIENGIYAWTSNGTNHSGMYRWYNSSPNKASLYTPSETPVVGDILYNADGSDSNDRVTAIVTNTQGAITGIRNSQNYLYTGPYENPVRVENPKLWVFDARKQKIISLDLNKYSPEVPIQTELIGLWVPPFQDTVNEFVIEYKYVSPTETSKTGAFERYTINLTKNRIFCTQRETLVTSSPSVGLAAKSYTSLPYFMYMQKNNFQHYGQRFRAINSILPTDITGISLATGLYLEDSKIEYGTLTNLGGYAPNRSAVSKFSGSTRYFQMTNNLDGTPTLKEITLSPTISNGTTSAYSIESVCKYSALIWGLVSSSTGYQLSYNNDQYSSRLIPLTSDNSSSVITNSTISSISVYPGYNKFSILASTSANKIWQNINLYSSKQTKLYKWYNGDGLVNIYTTTKEPDSNSILYSESGLPYTSQQARVDSFVDGELYIEGQLLSGVWDLTASPDTTKDVISPNLVDISNNRNSLYNVTQARVMGISEIEPRNQKDDYYGTFYPITAKATELLALSAKDDPKVLIYVQRQNTDQDPSIIAGSYVVDNINTPIKTTGNPAIRCYKSSKANKVTVYFHEHDSIVDGIQVGDPVYNRDGSLYQVDGKNVTVSSVDPRGVWIKLSTGLTVWNYWSDWNPEQDYITLVKQQNGYWETSSPFKGHTQFEASPTNNRILTPRYYLSFSNSEHYQTIVLRPSQSGTNLMYQDTWPLGTIESTSYDSTLSTYTHTINTGSSTVSITSKWKEFDINVPWALYITDESAGTVKADLLVINDNIDRVTSLHTYESSVEYDRARLYEYFGITPNKFEDITYYQYENPTPSASYDVYVYVKSETPTVGDLAYRTLSGGNYIEYNDSGKSYTSLLFHRSEYKPPIVTAIDGDTITISDGKTYKKTSVKYLSKETSNVENADGLTYQLRKYKTEIASKIGFQAYGNSVSNNTPLYSCSFADEYRALNDPNYAFLSDTQNSYQFGQDWFIDGKNLIYSFCGYQYLTSLPSKSDFYPYFRSE